MKTKDLEKEVNCPECWYLIEYSDSDKYPTGCGVCGRSLEDLLKIDAEYWEISKK